MLGDIGDWGTKTLLCILCEESVVFGQLELKNQL